MYTDPEVLTGGTFSMSQMIEMKLHPSLMQQDKAGDKSKFFVKLNLEPPTQVMLLLLTWGKKNTNQSFIITKMLFSFFEQLSQPKCQLKAQTSLESYLSSTLRPERETGHVLSSSSRIRKNLKGTVHLQAVKIFIWILAVTVTRSKVTAVLQSEYSLAFNSSF